MEKRICAKCREIVTSEMTDEMAMVEYEGQFYHRDCCPVRMKKCDGCGDFFRSHQLSRRSYFDKELCPHCLREAKEISATDIYWRSFYAKN